MTQATNLLLIGSGIPTKRWGSQNNFLAGATGSGRMLLPIKDNNANIQVLAMTDWGILVQKSGASYTTITGASWPSGYNVEATELGNKIYLTSETRELVRYDFSTLTSFATIASPTGLYVTNLSGATGVSTWSWTVTASSNSGGETIGSTRYSLVSLPQDLTSTTMRLSWTPVSAASGVLTGYDVYRGNPGEETWVGGTNADSTHFDDVGTFSSDPFRVSPLTNSTGGIKAKYVIRFQDRLVYSGLPGDPTNIVISARYPQHEKNDIFSGGGFVKIEPDSGEAITGLASYYSVNTGIQTIIVFKEHSVWELRLDQVQFGEWVLLDPEYRLLTQSQGCSSHRSVVAVENDIMFINRRGVYILRYEPQLLNVINANEISAKIRPFFLGLTQADLNAATAVYVDKKYIVSFPISKQSVMFDRERLSFMGPWITPFGINRWASYVDAAGMEHWLAMDADDNYVSEFSSGYPDDKGTPINTIFKSRREDFSDWTIYKTIQEVFMNFANTRGTITVNIYLEDRDGITSIVKAFTIVSTGTSGTSGMGTDQLGTVQLGLTQNKATTFAGEVPERALIYETGRIVQIEVRTSGSSDNYELLGVKVIGLPQPRGNAPSAWQV